MRLPARLAWLLALPLAAAAPAAGAAAVDLDGTWYVLVHYRDEATNHPERERWEDRLWVFERQGEELAWTDYPIVVFQNEDGRFENLGTNRQARVMHFWEPNDEQRAEIAEGLEYNSRGQRSKTLERTGEDGWSSASGDGGGYSSARYITYTETWTIQDPQDTPRFAWGASMGSAVSASFEGSTIFETTEVLEDGNLLLGRYERDGTRKGSFRAIRTGTAESVKSRYASEGEKAYVVLFGEMGKQLFAGEVPGGGAEAALRERIEAGTFREEDRRELRVQFEGWVGEQFRRQGNEDLRPFQPQIQSLARQMTALVVDEGKSIEEVGAMLQDGRLRP